MPQNWKTYELRDLVNYVNGGSWAASCYDNTGIPVVRVSDVNNGTVDLTNCKYLKLEFEEKYKKHSLNYKDVIVCTVGSHPDQQSSVVGGIGIVDSNSTGAFLNQNAVLLRSENSDVLNQIWLGYFCKSSIVKNHIESEARGSANQVRIAISNLLNLNLNLPPLPEQTAIASILSTIDAKIENNLAINKTLEEMAMALYKEWFVDFGPFQDGKFVDSELGMIPEGWEVKRLEYFIDLNPRLSIPKGKLTTYAEMKILPTNSMSISEVVKKEFKGGSKFQNGDTLFARITPCLENGKTAYVDFLDDNEIAFGSTEFLVMRAKNNVSKFWVYCISRDPNFRNFSISTMVGSSGRQRVQNQPFLSYEIAMPSVDIFSDFEEKVEPFFKQIRQGILANQSLTTLRDTLLPKLISGEVRLNEFANR